jgi:hypothetical protein
MKHIFVVMSLGAGIFASSMPAQRAGFHFGGTVPGFGRSGIGGLGFRGNRFGAFGGSQWLYPATYGDYGFFGDYGDGYPPQSNTFIVMPQPPAPPEAPPPPPPPPAAPLIREYHWPTSTNVPEPFSIVMNDGTTHYASMVWVQGGVVHFNAAEGGTGRVPLSAVSRVRTKEANAKKSLNLPLP